MTDSEKFEAYGRAVAGLKQAKFDFAAAQKRLRGAIDNLRSTVDAVESFLRDPLRRDQNNRPIADYAYGWHAELQKEKLPDLVNDVFTLATKIEKLQAEVDAFDK